jgi:hypothetical protein
LTLQIQAQAEKTLLVDEEVADWLMPRVVQHLLMIAL